MTKTIEERIKEAAKEEVMFNTFVYPSSATGCDFEKGTRFGIEIGRERAIREVVGWISIHRSREGAKHGHVWAERIEQHFLKQETK